jgi:hypothetical protein
MRQGAIVPCLITYLTDYGYLYFVAAATSGRKRKLTYLKLTYYETTPSGSQLCFEYRHIV